MQDRVCFMGTDRFVHAWDRTQGNPGWKYSANVYKKKVAIVYFLESQCFSFYGEKSWIKRNYIFFSAAFLQNN